jgi:dUTP pyrophosphatase
MKAHPSDAGFDLTAVSVEEDRKRNIVTYHTGISVSLPEGYFGLLCPRSSVYKHQLQLANGLGIIDQGYHGELIFKYRIVQPHISRYPVGERVGQLVVVPYPELELEEVDEFEDSDRGTGGFGSSDNK